MRVIGRLVAGPEIHTILWHRERESKQQVVEYFGNVPMKAGV